MKHEPDCGCLACYQALRQFRDDAKALVEEWRIRETVYAEVYAKVVIKACADQLAALLGETEEKTLA